MGPCQGYPIGLELSGWQDWRTCPNSLLLLLLLSRFSHVGLCGSAAPGVLQARILEWAAISFSAQTLESGNSV